MKGGSELPLGGVRILIVGQSANGGFRVCWGTLTASVVMAVVGCRYEQGTAYEAPR